MGLGQALRGAHRIVIDVVAGGIDQGDNGALFQVEDAGPLHQDVAGHCHLQLLQDDLGVGPDVCHGAHERLDEDLGIAGRLDQRAFRQLGADQEVNPPGLLGELDLRRPGHLQDLGLGGAVLPHGAGRGDRRGIQRDLGGIGVGNRRAGDGHVGRLAGQGRLDDRFLAGSQVLARRHKGAVQPALLHGRPPEDELEIGRLGGEAERGLLAAALDGEQGDRGMGGLEDEVRAARELRGVDVHLAAADRDVALGIGGLDLRVEGDREGLLLVPVHPQLGLFVEGEAGVVREKEGGLRARGRLHDGAFGRQGVALLERGRGAPGHHLGRAGDPPHVELAPGHGGIRVPGPRAGGEPGLGAHRRADQGFLAGCQGKDRADAAVGLARVHVGQALGHDDVGPLVVDADRGFLAAFLAVHDPDEAVDRLEGQVGAGKKLGRVDVDRAAAEDEHALGIRGLDAFEHAAGSEGLLLELLHIELGVVAEGQDRLVGEEEVGLAVLSGLDRGPVGHDGGVLLERSRLAGDGVGHFAGGPDHVELPEGHGVVVAAGRARGRRGRRLEVGGAVADRDGGGVGAVFRVIGIAERGQDERLLVREDHPPEEHQLAVLVAHVDPGLAQDHRKVGPLLVGLEVGLLAARLVVEDGAGAVLGLKDHAGAGQELGGVDRDRAVLDIDDQRGIGRLDQQVVVRLERLLVELLHAQLGVRQDADGRLVREEQDGASLVVREDAGTPGDEVVALPEVGDAACLAVDGLDLAGDIGDVKDARDLALAGFGVRREDLAEKIDRGHGQAGAQGEQQDAPDKSKSRFHG